MSTADTLLSEQDLGKDIGLGVSYLLGWVYFLAWSASFYPQVILNHQRKSVRGLSLDFIYLNLVGFSFYTTYNLALYMNEGVRETYRRRHHGQDPSVHLNDIFFGIHALVLTLITLGQVFRYKNEHIRLLPRTTMILTPLALGALLYQCILAGRGRMEWLDVMYFMGSIKVTISFVKYCPQLYMNYRRRSTAGWSIGNILLDITGGVLSISQEILDAYILQDWGSITGNPVKFGLGFVSIGFDLAFIFQHYVLYRRPPDEYAPIGEESV